MRRLFCAYVFTAALALLGAPAHAQSPGFDAELAAIQDAWASANYETPAGEPRVAAFETLSNRAAAFVKANPGRAEPLIWQGIVLSTYAGAKGGLGALSLAKQSRAALEGALRIDPNALDGSAYTSLGALYFKVPGFPLGFGDKKKAREHLERALAISPDGLDPNFFYGEFLLEQDEYARALQHLEKARRAPARPGRELADSGRRKEIEALIANLQAKVHAG
jgi:tetratricopeptide (TPR) repeat protein